MSEHLPEIFEGTTIHLYTWETYPYAPALFAQPECSTRGEAVNLLQKFAAAAGFKLGRVERDLRRRWIGRLDVN